MIAPIHRNEKDMKALGDQFRQDTKNDRNAFITVYDDEIAWRTAKDAVADRLGDKDLAYHDKHMIGDYAQNANTGFHVFNIFWILTVNSSRSSTKPATDSHVANAGGGRPASEVRWPAAGPSSRNTQERKGRPLSNPNKRGKLYRVRSMRLQSQRARPPGRRRSKARPVPLVAPSRGDRPAPALMEQPDAAA